jgi:hypothetical protein
MTDADPGTSAESESVVIEEQTGYIPTDDEDEIVEGEGSADVRGGTADSERP